MAQQYLQAGRNPAKSLLLVKTVRHPKPMPQQVVRDLMEVKVIELTAQAQKLTEDRLARLRASSSPLTPGSENWQDSEVVCWGCRQTGHIRRNCPHAKGSKRPAGRQRKAEENYSVIDSIIYGPTVSINGSINGHPISTLVDTGSAVTILHANAWKSSNSSNSTSLREPEWPVVAANGENLALGEATVSVPIGKTYVQHPVLVAHNLTQECLLSADFLTNQGCIVDLQQRVITRGEEAPFFQHW